VSPSKRCGSSSMTHGTSPAGTTPGSASSVWSSELGRQLPRVRSRRSPRIAWCSVNAPNEDWPLSFISAALWLAALLMKLRMTNCSYMEGSSGKKYDQHVRRTQVVLDLACLRLVNLRLNRRVCVSKIRGSPRRRRGAWADHVPSVSADAQPSATRLARISDCRLQHVLPPTRCMHRLRRN
jgi:hypothetical protein